MALPQAIQAQLEKAEAIEQAIAASQAVENQPVAAAPEPQQEPVQESAQAEPAAVATPEAAPVAQEQGPDYWKSRFETVQGKYNSETPKLYQQLREAEQYQHQLVARLEELEKRPEPKQPELLVNKEDEDNYGADMLEAIGRKAASLYETRVHSLERQVSQLLKVADTVGAVAERQVQSDGERFWNKVGEQVPDWAAVDNDSRWGDWLNHRAPGAKLTYRQLAADAINSYDPEPIAELVGLWKATLPPAAPVPTQPTAAHQELSRQVAPSTARASSVPATEKVWTQADYAQAYDQRNAQRMPPQEWQALMAEADRAVAEGRIRM